jgi:hypothetical protein
MYKPETQLIMDQLWAAAAAHKLGFEVESKIPFSDNTSVWTHGFIRAADAWMITVTKSGPNAAWRFYPDIKDNDFYMRCDGYGYEYLDSQDMECFERIIERNGIPFPQFSEVIEPQG